MLKTLFLLATATVGPQPPEQQAAENEATASQSVEFLGVRFCAGPSAEDDCDLQLFLPSRGQSPTADSNTGVPTMLSVLGKKLCVGDVPAPSSCDIHFGEGA